ncbi:phosphogluconate dehydrogenase (NAD(+)-dependent, decarboxylating) [Anaerorhabdus sp.]|jgi:6-phosphogluconate dehydrogenase|uniref:phosphogluconate dehydrogenase (NAD(+)-dependent, decarboxylating) n=1 Tax=Anaerorhabdus sp. TaxID=1872524 RepID=UPI002FC951FF
MELKFIGLGKMGHNLALNAIDKGHNVLGFDISADSRNNAKNLGINVVETLEDLLKERNGKRIVFLSVVSGNPTNELIKQLSVMLDAGDIVIDSGNSNFNDSVSNYKMLKEKSIDFLDCGTSGGISGARNGACLMIGGDADVYAEVEPFFESVAIKDGCLYTGEAGSGHYLKMIHNGIEYGMMQAIGEGFDILNESEFNYDYEKVAKVWNHGSVVRSWLMELAEEGFKDDKHLDKIEGVIDASGEAKWTVQEALRLNIPAPVITTSLYVRNASKITNSFSNRVVAILRHGFGGHAVTYRKDN